MSTHNRNGQTGRPGVSLDTRHLASWWGSELKRAFLKARGSECNGPLSLLLSTPFFQYVSYVAETESALFDLGLGPGFRTRDWKPAG